MGCGCKKGKSKGVANMLHDINLVKWVKDVWNKKISETPFEELNEEQCNLVSELYGEIWIHSKPASLRSKYDKLKSIQ